MNKEALRILKIATCPSLSTRSTLTYHIGCGDDQSIHLRIYQNSGTGIFSRDWLALALLDPLLTSDEKPITAGMLKELFKGKSVNTTGFTIAALISEGLLKGAEGSQKSYRRVDPTKFMAEIQALIDAGTSLNDTLPVPDKGKDTKTKKSAPKKNIADKARKEPK